MARKPKPKTTLSEEQKIFIIQRLACFDPLKAVIEGFKEVWPDFAGDLKPQNVQAYDPTKHAGRDLAGKHKELFEKTRAAFIEDASTIGVAHKSVRLRKLHTYVEAAEARGNYPLAAALLEQAAKDAGDGYSNKRRLIGGDKGDPPIEVESPLDRLRARMSTIAARKQPAAPKKKK